MTLFIDLDGPILNTVQRNFQVYRTLVEQAGGGVMLDQESFWELKRAGKSSAELLLHTEGARPDREAFQQRWLDEIEMPRWLALDTVQARAQETLTALSRRFPLVLVTLRQSREHLDQQLIRLDLTQFFRTVLSGSPLAGDGVETKRRLILSSGFKTVGFMIGDTEIDLRAGRSVGLRTIGVTCGIRNLPHLAAEKPDALVPDLAAAAEIVLTSAAGTAT